ncbi:MAG: hypothetical protein QXP36_11505 [Conexivisphaerales archaeon]
MQSILNIDFIYGVASLVECSIVLMLDVLLMRKIKSNPLVYISGFLLNKNRTNSFVALFFTFAVLSLAYIASSIISLSYIYSPVWEIGNMIVFALVILFYFLLIR